MLSRVLCLYGANDLIVVQFSFHQYYSSVWSDLYRIERRALTGPRNVQFTSRNEQPHELEHRVRLRPSLVPIPIPRPDSRPGRRQRRRHDAGSAAVSSSLANSPSSRKPTTLRGTRKRAEVSCLSGHMTIK